MIWSFYFYSISFCFPGFGSGYLAHQLSPPAQPPSFLSLSPLPTTLRTTVPAASAMARSGSQASTLVAPEQQLMSLFVTNYTVTNLLLLCLWYCFSHFYILVYLRGCGWALCSSEDWHWPITQQPAGQYYCVRRPCNWCIQCRQPRNPNNGQSILWLYYGYLYCLFNTYICGGRGQKKKKILSFV